MRLSEYFSWSILPLCLSAIAYYAYAIYAARDFFTRSTPSNPDFHPPITVLKPLCGLDFDAYENLASFCRQDYPNYQIVFAVQQENDPSLNVVEQLMYDFPSTDISLVVNSRTIGNNFKVSNLANAMEAAKHDILVIADSDIRVSSDYLQKTLQPLQDENVAVVTCLYNSRTKDRLSAFEALGIATQFHPSVLVARKLEGMRFAFGSTIVIRKSVLEKIGGFEAIADRLADDFYLGNLPARSGYRVILSDYIVEHSLATESFAEFMQRQIRWMRCIRVERFWSYFGLLFTHGTATSLLFVIASFGSLASWMVLAIVWGIRGVMAWTIAVKFLKDPVSQKHFWFLYFRDLLGFVIWCCGLVGDRIEWRERKFKLSKDGKLIRL